GRVAEAAELTAALGRAADGSAELLLLVGGSGIGKSALVQDVLGPTVDRRGYFIRGKFDQYSGSAPYASLIDAVRELVRQLLGEPPERIAAWREQILTALAGNAAVVGDVIPDVTLITGTLPPVAELGPTETQNRFNLVFRQFIRTFARPQQPLVIFLDDLHWADVASIRLLRTLVSDPEARHLLIIGAYRPEAVDPSGPLAVAITALDPSSVRRIDLAPLDVASVTDLVADTVRASGDEVASFAGLVHDRTAGNPFFVNQFLRSLFEDGLIRFAADSGRWSWDLTGIRKRSVTDNVVELMAGRVGELPAGTQEALRTAAVIGNAFDLGTLAPALAVTPADAARWLGDAITAGLLLPLGDDHELVAEGFGGTDPFGVAYRFLHDRVQQACHSLITPEEVAAVHLRVGQLLLDRLRQQGRDDDLFEVTTHLNAALPALSADGRRLELAGLNLEAARKARASNAYDAALHYAEAGTVLLPPDAWNGVYELAFGLRLLRAQALAVVGRIEEAEEGFAALLPQARPGFDRAEMCDIRSEVLLIAGRPAEAYAAGRAGLEQLGIAFPATADEAARQTEALYSSFLDLSVVDRLERLDQGDEDTLLAGRLFWRAIISAYWSQPEDMPFLVGTSVDHVLRTGLNPHTGAILGYLALVLNGRGHIEVAMAYAEAARRIAERFTDPLFRARAGMMPWVTLCLKYPFAVGEQAMDDAMALCYGAGDLEFVNHSMIGRYMCAHAAGRDFPTILDLCERWLDFCLTFAPLEAGQARIRAAAHRRLMALEPRPDDPVPMDPEAILREYEEQGDVTDVCESLEELTRIETLFGNYGAAYAYGRRADPLVDAGAAATLLFNYLFWMDYAIAAARVEDLATADSLLAKMRPVAEFNPDNFRSYYALAAAERARAAGDSDGAVGGYLRTIEHAGTHGYVLLEAFANELLGRHFRDRGHRFALAHFQEARALYLECGARGKAIHLEEEIPELRKAAAGSRGLGMSFTPTTDRGSAHLDLGTALKASLAIAGEIALDQVVDRLVAISIENAGAERGVFVSVDGEDLRVEAEGVAGGEVRRHGSVPLDDEGDVVPAGLVRAAARTGEAVVQPDTLVLPITRKGDVTGVLYLENTLVSGAFTPERLALLEVLSGQMAISLENARLYAHLEEKVAERTRELSDA
ncbi:MAG: AAA family ATPase, partial [Acidimicrobiia bacterium]